MRNPESARELQRTLGHRREVACLGQDHDEAIKGFARDLCRIGRVRSSASRFGMLAGTHGLPDLGHDREPVA